MISTPSLHLVTAVIAKESKQLRTAPRRCCDRSGVMTAVNAKVRAHLITVVVTK
jgi:hypothetical protein